MKATRLAIPEVVLLQPKVFGDERGFFYESFNQQRFEEAIGRSVPFVQDNHSCSAKGVLRGLHYQVQQPQGKLVRVVAGEVFDVAVDLRAGSKTFGQWVGEFLNTLISGNYGGGKALPMFFWCCLIAQISYTSPPVTSHRRMNVILFKIMGLLAIPWPAVKSPSLSFKYACASLFAPAEVIIG